MGIIKNVALSNTNITTTGKIGDISYGEPPLQNVEKSWYDIVRDMVKKYGNDEELGAALRKLVNK